MYGRSPGAPQVWSLAIATQKVAGACQSAAIKRVRALAWSADLVSRFASFSDMADAVGKIFPRMYTNLHELWDVRALAWSADLVSRFASFRDMADAVGKIFPRMYTNGATSSQL